MQRSRIVGLVEWASTSYGVLCVPTLKRSAHSQPEANASAVAYGQPVHQTHPWLLQAGECAPGITFRELQQRRQKLAEMMPEGSVAVLPSAALRYMAGVIPYTYRQDADFRYLTGVTQQGLAIFHKRSSAPELHYTLLLAQRSADREVWDGRCMSMEAAAEPFAADAVGSLCESALTDILVEKLRPASMLLLDRDRYCPILTRCLPEILKTAGVGSARLPKRSAGHSRPPSPHAPSPLSLHSAFLSPFRPYAHFLRWAKSPAECRAMAAAVGLGTSALKTCMAATHAGMSEAEIGALFEFKCASGGSSRLAYPSVVASGADACTIHYGRNDKRLENGGLLLMDAGCELWGYSSDVTRTWPVSGRFSPAQRRVYEHVLAVHKACLAECRPGARLRDIHHLSTSMLAEAMRDLGIQGRGGGSLAESGYRDFYPHSIGHWLGLDTHDANLITHDTPFVEGCVLTIEPGLYLPAGPGVPPEFADIGVRIEDDVLITEHGAVVLSAAAPIEVDEIEALVGTGVKTWQALQSF